MRVIERRDRACFAFQAIAESWGLREFITHHLESDGAAEACIGGAINLPHAAHADEFLQDVRADCPSPAVSARCDFKNEAWSHNANVLRTAIWRLAAVGRQSSSSSQITFICGAAPHTSRLSGADLVCEGVSSEATPHTGPGKQ